MNKIDIFLQLPPGTLYKVLIAKDRIMLPVVQDKLFMHGIDITPKLDITEESNESWRELCVKAGYKTLCLGE